MAYPHPAEKDFPGIIGRTVADSTPDWGGPGFRDRGPSVVMIVLDDTGFAHLGCFGSSIETPNIDRLAGHGLRYNNFHTTALCSASRACLLTGRNHHAVGIRAVSNMDTGYPNTRGAVTPGAATIAEVLRDSGYGTFAAGKWHLAPMGECTAAGPFRNWPLGKGFDGFYGFLQGETDQFTPELTRDNHFVPQPKPVAEGYHFSEDVVDRAIGYLRDQVSLVPEKPFFLYLAFGAMHSPHQAPTAWREKYRGRFDEGWDVARERWLARQKELGIVPPDTGLAPRNPGVRPWDELGRNEQRFAAALQEAFAAMLDHTDHQVGRLVDFLESMGLADDTLLLLVSDNGASQEGGASGIMEEMKHFNLMEEDVDRAVERLDDIGGPDSHSNIPWGWAQAGNTPLKWYKQNTHGGGVRDPLIVHWPARIGTPGEIRAQFCHAVDIVPTVLDAAGLEMPASVAGIEQMPLHGVSLLPTFTDRSAAPGRGAQYFEMLSHRGIWKDGWKAVTHHQSGVPFDEDPWELYHLERDFSECRDLAATEPGRLQAMVEAWWREAEIHGVLPLDDRPPLELFRASRRRPGLPAARHRFVYYPPLSHIVADACPPAFHGWRTTVDFEYDPARPDGALVARGNRNSGFVLYVTGGRPVFHYNAFHEHTSIACPGTLNAGRHRLKLEVRRADDGGGEVGLRVDDRPVVRGRLPRLLLIVSSLGMDFGCSPSPICPDYAAPFRYASPIRRVIFELPGRPPGDLAARADEADVRTAASRQ